MSTLHKVTAALCFITLNAGGLCGEEQPFSKLPIRIANRDTLSSTDDSGQEGKTVWEYLGSTEGLGEESESKGRRDDRVDRRMFDQMRMSNALTSPLSSDLVGFSVVRASNSSLQATMEGRGRVVFDNVFTDVDGAWDKSLGVFRCPKPGLYFFSFNARGAPKNDMDANGWMLSLMLNGVDVVSIGSPTESSASNSVLLPLNSKDQVWLQLSQGRLLEPFDKSQTSMTSFAGFRIGGLSNPENPDRRKTPETGRPFIGNEDVYGRRRPQRPLSIDRYSSSPSSTFYGENSSSTRDRYRPYYYYPVSERRRPYTQPGGSLSSESYVPPFTSLAEASKGKYPDYPRRKFYPLSTNYLDDERRNFIRRRGLRSSTSSDD